MDDQKIEVGIIVGVHGIKGQVKVKSMTEEPSDFLSYGPLFFADGSQVPKIKIDGRAKGSLIVSVQGVAYRDQAERLKGKSLFVPAQALPKVNEDEFYASDLAGLSVRNETGEHIGEVIALLDFGAGDLLEIENTEGKLLYYPFTLAVFPDVDLQARTINFVPPDEVTSQDESGQVH